MEILQFIFSGFWTFIGIFLLLIIVFDGIAKIIRAIRGIPKSKKEDSSVIKVSVK